MVFLPGKREVALLSEKLDDAARGDLTIKSVVGGQTVEVQEQTLQRSVNAVDQRTVILGTDVVESSVTIPDVDVIIDSCEHKRLRWDGQRRQYLLTLMLISQVHNWTRLPTSRMFRDGPLPLSPPSCPLLWGVVVGPPRRHQ